MIVKSVQSTRRMRHFTQILFLLMMTLTPIFDLFRMDMAESTFVILGKHFFINQLYLAVIAFVLSLLILTLIARNFGRIFCGWLCFQTTWSEMGDLIVKKWREFKRVKKTPKKIANLLQVILLLLLSVPLMLGFYTVLVSYFVAPKVIWAWITLGPPGWFLVLFAKFSVVGLIDLLIIRHSFCQSMCPYGIMQQKAKKNSALRITFDPEQCIDCNLCDKACLMKLKPRELNMADPCINCVECIVACGVKAEKLAAKGIAKGSVNSLSLSYTPIEATEKKVPVFDGKSLLIGAIFAVFSGVLLIGVMLDDGTDLSINQKKVTEVSAAVSPVASGAVPYNLKVTNRTQEARNFTLHIETLDSGTSAIAGQKKANFEIKPTEISVGPLTKFEESVSIVPTSKLQSGRYTILIQLLTPDNQVVDETKTVYYVY